MKHLKFLGVCIVKILKTLKKHLKLFWERILFHIFTSLSFYQWTVLRAGFEKYCNVRCKLNSLGHIEFRVLGFDASLVHRSWKIDFIKFRDKLCDRRHGVLCLCIVWYEWDLIGKTKLIGSPCITLGRKKMGWIVTRIHSLM